MEALKTIFKGNNRRPKTIRFDQGGEFKSNVKKYLDKENIHFTLKTVKLNPTMLKE